MYMRLNKGHSIFLPLIQVVLLVDSMSSQLLNIVPNGLNRVCPYNQNETCLTLSELASNTSRLDQANITLNFLPGDHVLAQRISVSSAVNLVLTGHICNASQCETNINCQGTSGFEFENIETINITGLAFSGCGGEGTNGGALNINNVTFVSILSCHFIGNRVFGEKALGGAVYIGTAFDISIHSSYFVNNSAQCEYNVHRSCDSGWNGGGAIFILDSREAVLISCHFERNIASTHGGAIASTRTTLIVSHTMFVYNQAFGEVVFSERGNLYPSNYNETKSGGAIYVTKGNISASNCDFEFNTAIRGGAIHISQGTISTLMTNYIGNLANNFGGAIFINASFLSSENDCFKSNNASNAGGAIISYGGSLFSTHTYYSGNSADTGGAIYVDRFSRIASSHDSYINNSAALFGGGIGSNTSSISGTNNTYSNNRAESGGAIYLEYSYMSGVGGYYEMNRADLSGGAIYASNANVSTSDSYFVNNSAKNGLIYISMGNVSMTGSNFSDNQAAKGAVIVVKNSSVHINSCFYTNNRANLYGGGVMYAESSSIKSFHSYYVNNSATIGGVFLVFDTSLQTSQSYYTNNRALQGGVILAIGQCTEENHACNIISTSSYYLSNSASQIGGAIYTLMYNVNVTNDLYSHNHAKLGGALYVSQGPVSISGANFSYNNASLGGGAIQSLQSSLSISDSSFTSNIGIGGGGAIVFNGTLLAIVHSNFTHNKGYVGGAVQVNHGNLTSVGSHYVSNSATISGGAIGIVTGSLYSTSCQFKNNQVGLQDRAILVVIGNTTSFYTRNEAGVGSGAAVYVYRGSVSIYSSNFTNNLGGAIRIETEGLIFSSDSCYVNNTGYNGGVMFVREGNIYSNGSRYLNNSAYHGGALHVRGGNITSVNSLFHYNRARYGGSIFAQTNTVSSIGCQYEDNMASYSGGAIWSVGGTITSTDTNYTNNYSDNLGGALFAFGGNISTRNSNFINNKAHRAGGAICALLSYVYSDSSHYGNNVADEYGGAIYIDSCTHSDNPSLFQPGTDDKLLLASVNLICNENEYLKSPAFHIAKLDLSGNTLFTNNTCGLVGGAITSIQVQVCVNGTVPGAANNNTATYGGGLALVWSTLSVHSPIEIQHNKATMSGGGIFLYQSDIVFSAQEMMSIGGNTALQNGGGVYAINSYIKIAGGVVHFENNAAIKGAAIFLEQNSKIHLLKERLETVGEYDMRLEFINNHAQYGGAVLVSDSSENIIACERGVAGEDLSKSTQECFIQTLLSDTTVSKNNTKINYINVFFVNNTASVRGGAIDGGLLDRCIMNVSAELVTQFPEYQRSTGFDYIRATVQFAGLVDYDNLTLNYSPDKLINAITSSDVEGLVSSEPVRVCFCLEGTPNCSYHHPDVYTKRGQLFRLSVVPVDQVGNPINATVISSFLSNNGELNVDKTRQETTTHCTKLQYNVYPKVTAKHAQLELYAEGPCRDNGISKRILNVIFLPCTCPIGFQSSETETRCSCLCDPLLATYIVNCSYENETVLRARNVWIDYVNTTAEDGYLLYPNCPFDYCVDKPVNINLNIPDGADIQCAFNRSGILCGACKKNMSLLLGSSRCQQCSNSFIALLIPISLAGIALVAFVMALNLTVASGTIHGLIFYANILIASRSLFIPFETPNVLSIFISWINLDLGIEACFYNGMDSYSKVLLQLAFPTYIVLITIMIIIISEYSIPFATFIGKKDPVATLCTLILLSYSKLIRTIISSLQFTYLNYPDGSSEIVWLYDANVPYFTPSHIPRFITAIIIIILGFVYTVLIFFGQWIQRCGNRRFIRWVNNPKYTAFITKYHAPFTTKQRYWVGLLLFARFLHYLVSAFVTDAAILLSVFCIVGGLVLIKLLNYVKTYNNRILDALEVSFLVNLEAFVAATYYVGGDRGKQRTLAVISLSLSFITFWGLLIYHSYMHILKDTQVWIRLKQSLQRMIQLPNRHREFEMVPLEEDDHEDNVEEDGEDEQLLEVQPPYTGQDVDRHSIDLPHDHDPPVIVPAVRYDQLREPDLDILNPITTDDYRLLNQPPAPRPRQVPTSTVIDFVRPAKDNN